MQCHRTMVQLTKKKSWARKQHSYAYICKICQDVDLSHKFYTLKRISQKLLEMAISYHLAIVTMPKDSDPAF